MADKEEPLELRFRIFDGTDLCQGFYPLTTSTDAIKQMLLSEWPQDKPIRPTSVHDIKLVNAGQVLGDGRTLAESRVCVVPGEVTTMLVNVQPPEARRRPENQNPRCCPVL